MRKATLKIKVPKILFTKLKPVISAIEEQKIKRVKKSDIWTSAAWLLLKNFSNSTHLYNAIINAKLEMNKPIPKKITTTTTTTPTQCSHTKKKN
jgi:hypothetical protein